MYSIFFPLKNYKQICKKRLSKIGNRHDLNKKANFFLYKICSKKLALFMPKIGMFLKKKLDDVITSVSKYGIICKFGLKWTLLNPI
jgi:hypothetical protein